MCARVLLKEKKYLINGVLLLASCFYKVKAERDAKWSATIRAAALTLRSGDKL